MPEYSIKLEKNGRIAFIEHRSIVFVCFFGLQLYSLKLFIVKFIRKCNEQIFMFVTEIGGQWIEFGT